LAQVPLWAWPLAVAGLWGSYGLRAERLRREWGTWGRTHRPEARMPSLSDSVDLFLTHNAALLLLPMRAGEAGYPWLLHRRFGIPVAESVRSLVWLRLQDALVLALLGLLGLAPGPAWLRLAGVAALVLLLWGLLPRLSRQLGQWWPRWQALQGTLVAHRGDLTGWGLCVGNWLLKLAVLGGVLALLAGLPVWQGWSGRWRVNSPRPCPSRPRPAWAATRPPSGLRDNGWGPRCRRPCWPVPRWRCTP
jgi:hypothetical protein